MLGLGEPPQITSRGVRLSLFVRAVTNEDMRGNSRLSRTLDLFFTWLKVQKFDAFAEWLRPGGGELAQPLYLGAFPCNSGILPMRQLPCILLLDIHSFAHGVVKAEPPRGVPEYARLQCFLHCLPAKELDRDKSWVLRRCYMKTLLDSELRRRGVDLNPIGFRRGPDHFWTWLTPKPRILQDALYFSTLNGVYQVGSRWCLRLGPNLEDAKKFPGTFICVAEQNGRHYWMDCRVGFDTWDDYDSAEKFATKDLSSLWVEAPSEPGPVCQTRLEFAAGSLLITLYNTRHDGDTSYGVHLGFIWKKGDRKDATSGGKAPFQG
jgi:hypothetical protein